ncbi:MAG: hypothetical protein WA629_02145 [Candidatus Aquilonibacter sp.]
MRPVAPVLIAALALVPVVGSAAPITVTPTTLVLQIGGKVFGKVTASAASSNLTLAQSTCFTTAGSPRDILKVTGLNTSRGSASMTMSLDVRAQHPGTCVIRFQSESHVGTIDVTVKPED